MLPWHVDRLTRTLRDLEDVIDLHDKSGVPLATATGEIDLATPTGWLVARTLGGGCVLRSVQFPNSTAALKFRRGLGARPR
jgi:hypothetical protein